MSSGKKKKRKASSVDSENVRGGLHRVKKPKTFNGQRGLSKKGSDGAFKDVSLDASYRCFSYFTP